MEKAYQYFTKITRIAYTQGAFALAKRVWFAFRALRKPTPREPIGWSDMRVWAHKSTALSAHFMLAMRAEGTTHARWKAWTAPGSNASCSCREKPKSAWSFLRERTEKGVYGDRFRFSRDTFYKEC